MAETIRAASRSSRDRQAPTGHGSIECRRDRCRRCPSPGEPDRARGLLPSRPVRRQRRPRRSVRDRCPPTPHRRMRVDRGRQGSRMYRRHRPRRSRVRRTTCRDGLPPSRLRRFGEPRRSSLDFPASGGGKSARYRSRAAATCRPRRVPRRLDSSSRANRGRRAGHLRFRSARGR